MPCDLCKEIYVNLPCRNPKFYSSGLTLKDSIYSTYDYEYTRHLISVHVILTGFCPCKECLVRSMCKIKCDEYKYRVSAADNGLRKKG